MRQSTRLIVNSAANLFARVITVATRLQIVPFAIAALGRASYGLWIVVGQAFAYTRIFEIGLRSAVTRQVALRIERDEHELLGRYLNTACAYYCTVGVLVAVLAAVFSQYFCQWFDVPLAYQSDARIMVFIAGITLAATIPLYTYGAILAGFQRFGVVSGTQIGADLIRLVLILALIHSFDTGGGLILLAVASGGSVLLGAVGRTWAAMRIYPQARIRPLKLDPSLWWEMVTFGLNTVVYAMSIAVATQLAQILVGSMMSSAQATDFRLAMEPIVGLHAFIVACTVSITPAVSRLEGAGDPARIKKLFLRSSRYVGVATITGVVLACAFCRQFLELWQGTNYASATGGEVLDRIAATCRILVVGHGLFWLLLPAFNVFTGLGRHRVLAIVAAISGLVSMGLVAAFAVQPDASIDTVAWGVVLPIIPVWGVILPWYCCRALGQPIGKYLWDCVGVPALACVPVAAVAWWLTREAMAVSWGGFVVDVTVSGVVVLPLAYRFVLAPEDRARFTGVFKRTK